jgi:fumarate hydratase class I
MVGFIKEKILTLGTAACPPYHLAVVIGGTSAEMTLKTVKLASTKYLDALPTSGSESGHAFRDLDMEKEIHKATQSMGVGAQFGGKYFCHDVRVIRLPRHGASLPIGLGVSCSADRQAKGKITRDGIFLEALETNPSKYLPEVEDKHLNDGVVSIDLNRPMPEILAELSKHPVKTRLSLTGPIIVARDLAHAKIRARLERRSRHAGLLQEPPDLLCRARQDAGGLRLWLLRPDDRRPHGFLRRPVPVLRRLDGHARQGQPLAPGARRLRQAWRLLSRLDRRPGGAPRPGLHQKVEVVEYPELGMEAIWRIEVEDFPAFIVVDDKGNDFFKELNLE